MKKFKIIVSTVVLLLTVIVISGYANTYMVSESSETDPLPVEKQKQTANFFVTHGHCSTPFGGIVTDLKVNVSERNDLGNPLENMKISFEIDPHSFNVCSGEDLTARIKTPGLFIGANNEKIIFTSTQVYTMGVDWYQVNGTLSIMGMERDVKFFVTGIRAPKEAMATTLVLEGQMNLLDWGIDYDKIVFGTSDLVPTQWMYINMKIDMS